MNINNLFRIMMTFILFPVMGAEITDIRIDYQRPDFYLYLLSADRTLDHGYYQFNNRIKNRIFYDFTSDEFHQKVDENLVRNAVKAVYGADAMIGMSVFSLLFSGGFSILSVYTVSENRSFRIKFDVNLVRG